MLVLRPAQRSALALAACLLSTGLDASPLVMLGGPGHDTIDASALLSDGSLVIAGRLGTPSSEDPDGAQLVARLAPDGSLAWQRRIGEECPARSAGGFLGIAETPAGEILLYGASEHVLTRDGDLVATFTHDAYVDRLAVEPGPGGRFLGQRSTGYFPRGQSFATALSQDGTALFETATNVGRSRLLELGKSAWGADGSMLVEYQECWGLDMLDCLPAPHLLVRLRPDGNAAWSMETMSLGRFTGDDSGRTLVSGNWLGSYERGRFAVLDDAGRVVASRRIVLPDSYSSAPEVASAIPGGGWMLCGGSGGRGLVVATDADLVVRWARSIGPPDVSCAVGSVLVRPDGSSWIVGSFERFSGGSEGRQAFALLLPADGGDPDACADVTGASVDIVDEPPPADATPLSAAPGPTTSRTLTPAPAPVFADTGYAAATGSCGGCTPDTFEWDDGCGQALTPLRIGEQPRRANLCDDAADWTFFAAQPGNTYVLELDDLGGASDAAIDLVASDCTTILASDGDAPGPGAALSWSPSSEELLHVRVRPASGVPAPDTAYELRFSSPTAPGCSTWLVHQQVRAGGLGRFYTTTIHHTAFTLDGDVLVLLNDEGSSGRTILERRDGAGNIRWSRTFAEEAWPRGWWRVAELADGTILLAGSRGPCRIGLARFDAGGNLVRAQEVSFTAPGFTCPGQLWGSGVGVIVPQPDGSALMTANVSSGGGAAGTGFLFNLKSDDSIGWSKLVFAPDATPPTCCGNGCGLGGFSAMADGGLVATTCNALHRFGPTGDWLWSRRFESYQLSLEGRASNGRRTILVNHEYGLVSFREDGSVRWQRDVEAGPMLVLPDDGALIAYGDTLTRLRADGTTAWSEEREGYVAQGILAPRGDVLLSGASSPWRTCATREAQPDAFLARFDPSAGLPVACASSTPLPLVDGPPTSVVVLPATATTLDASASTTGMSLRFDAPAGLQILEPCPCNAPALGAPPEVSPPGSFHPLRVAAGGSMTWEPAIFTHSDAFRVRRGRIDDLSRAVPMACISGDVADPRFADPEPPPAGSGWAYLVSGVNAHGEGTVGAASTGAARAVEACR